MLDNKTGRYQRIKVVVGDMGDISRDILINGLTESGWADVVGSATSGEGLLHLIREKKPDLVLTDIILDGMNGFDVLRMLDKSGKRPIVVIVSAFINDNTMLKASSLGAAFFVKKAVRFGDGSCTNTGHSLCCG